LNRISDTKFAFWSALMAFTMAPVVAFAQSNMIVHVPVKIATAGKSITVEARVEGSQLPESAVLYFKIPDQSAYKMAEMERDQWRLKGTIGGIDVTERGLEYYIESVLTGGEVLTAPAGAPLSSSAYRINVSPAGAGSETAVSDPAIIILSPSPGSQVSGRELLVAIALNQSVRKMTPDNLILELNGTDITRRATIMPELITFVLKDIKPGNTSISLSIQQGKTRILLTNWSFQIEEEEEVRKVKKEFPVKGDFSVRQSHENISSKVRDVTVATGQLSGNLGKLNWMGMGLVSSLESKTLQPQNRYTAALKYGKASLKVGDTSPRFSQFTAWGARNRGFEFSYRGFAFNLDVAQGEMMRSIASGISAIDTLVVTDINGDTLKSALDPTRDSTRIDTTANYGTFRRSMVAVRPGFPLSDNVTLSFNFLKAKDDVGSITAGLNPKDNLVLGADLEIRSANRRFVFQTETAVSLFNSNINEPTMTQAERLKGLIIVNQYFEPLPTDSAILSDTITQVDLAKKLFEELIASSMASQTSLTLNLFHNELKLGYKSVGRSFKSLGSPSVQTDVKGFSITDRIRLFRNRVYLNLGYESLQDNVNGRQDSEQTLKRNAITGGIALYTPEYLPNLNFNARQNKRENSAEIIYITLPDGSADSTGNPVGDESSSFDVSADQEFSLFGVNHNAIVSYTSSIAEDKYNPSAANSMNSITIQLSSRKGERLETNISSSFTGQASQNDLNKVDYTVMGITSQYMLVREMLWINGGINYTTATGGLKPILSDPALGYAGYALEFSRLEFSIGSTYKFAERHELALSAYAVNHVDDGYSEAWTSEDPTTHQRTYVKSINKDSPTFVKQNDSAVRLRYSYRF